MSRFTSPETEAVDELLDGSRLTSNGLRSTPSSNLTNVSMSTSVGPASSSKAVLAALKALQDKIRRLESERSQHLDEINSLKNSLKSQEIEAEHLRQRDNLFNQRMLQEFKSGSEKVLNEKADMEAKLAKAEEKSKEYLKTSMSLQEKVASLENERELLNLRVNELESTQRLAESQGVRNQEREKGKNSGITRLCAPLIIVTTHRFNRNALKGSGQV